jgi:predicted RNase H-like HicB family nuclease
MPLQPTITAVISESEGWYVASCREISAVTQGRTFEELVENLREVVELHLEGDDPADYGLTPNPSIVMTFDVGVVSAQA